MTKKEIAREFADSAYEDAMEHGDDRLSNAIVEYMDAIRERAFAVESQDGDAMLFMRDLHDNLGQTLQAGL